MLCVHLANPCPQPAALMITRMLTPAAVQSPCEAANADALAARANAVDRPARAAVAGCSRRCAGASGDGAGQHMSGAHCDALWRC